MSLKQGALLFSVSIVALVAGCTPTAVEQPQPLVVTVTDGPVGITTKRAATFTFTSTKPAAFFECHLDSAPFAICTSPVTLSQLAEGAHVFQVRGYDAATGTTSDPAERAWTIDLSAPETSLTGTYPSATSSSSASIAFTSSEPTATFECRLDQGEFSACTSPKALADLSDGAHHFEVRAIDAAGNVDPTPAALDWTVDHTPPETTIDSGPNELVGADPVTFTFSADEANATFSCSLDEGAAESCTSPLTLSSLADGLHELSVTATDEAGNVDASPAVRTWTVDTQPPDTVLLSSMTTSSGATFVFDASEAGCTFQCSFDGAPFAACSSPQMLSNLPEGAHTFAIRALDALKNVDPTPASKTWVVDTQPPDTTITSAVTPANGKSTSISFLSDEAGCTFECSLDGAAFTACTSPVTYATLSDGNHSFAVRAKDVGSNLDVTPAAVTWTVDTTPPDTTLTSTTTDPQSANASFSFGATEQGCTFECRIDGGAFTACTSPVAYSALVDGNHSFAVRAIDPSGNVDPSPAAHNWTTSTASPETTITNATTSATSRSASFAFSCNKSGFTFECSMDGAAMTACVSPMSYSNLIDGSHTFAVRAIGTNSVVDPTPATQTWTIDLTPPDTTLLSTQASQSSTSATFTFQATEAGSTFQCKLDSAAYASCSSPQSYTGLADGPHSFSVRAIDSVGNVDASPATYAWTIDTTAPDTTLTNVQTAINSSSASFSFTASKPGTFECSLDSATFSACTSPASYSNLADGPHTFAVRAVEGSGTRDASPASTTWSIDTTPPDTTITSAPSGSVASTSATISFASSEANSTFQCSLDGVLFTACTSPVALSNLSAGAHTYRVQATDAAGNTGTTPASASWSVVSGAIDTTLTSKPGLTSGQTVSFSFTATQSGGTFQCKLDSASFTTCTSPTNYSSLALGSHTFQVRAVDSVGVADTTPESWTWQVQNGTLIRLVAANISSGSSQKYETAGMNILQGLHPDIAMLQEFNYGGNSKAELDSFVNTSFGPGFYYYRETTGSIPNGIISRYPILASGSWDDVTQNTREFAWARIDLPNTTADLWVISVHLKASSGATEEATRNSQSSALVSLINANIPATDYLALGGDFNTQTRAEPCVTTLSQVFTLPTTYWADQAGNTNTNNPSGPRNKPYDWVLADSDLNALEVPVVIGVNSFAHGLVFDSRLYSPLADVYPVLQTDSGAVNMQHMAIVRDFLIP